MNEVVTYSYDSETGLYYLQSRYYDPNTGRFLSADDTDELDNSKDSVLSPNLYAYCDNNPVNHTDSNGQWIVDAIFLVADVAEFASHPSWGGAAWILLDCACFVDASGAASAGSHAFKAAHAAEEAIHAVDEASHAEHVVKAARRAVRGAEHGNSLRTTKKAYGYALKDIKSDRILKYGETTRGVKRYTKKYYNQHKCTMEIRASGTKREMHYWQHERIMSYTKRYGHRPPLNKSNW